MAWQSSSWPTHASNADVVSGAWSQNDASDGGWESRWWLCSCCSGWTLAQKGKCRNCGVKKQYGQTANKPTTPSPTTSPATPVIWKNWSQPVTTTPPATSSQETSTQIKALEAALAQLPTGEIFEESRTSIKASLTALKSSVSKSKPLGLRLESCRAAVARATKRSAMAAEAVTTAVTEAKTTDEELAKFRRDLSDLENEMTAAVGGNSVQSMTTALERVVGEMRSSPLVPANLVQQAEQQMMLLVEGVKQISALAFQATQAQEMKEQVVKVSMPPLPERFSSGGRKRSSSVPLDSHPTAHLRLTGKQPSRAVVETPSDLANTHSVHIKNRFAALDFLPAGSSRTQPY